MTLTVRLDPLLASALDRYCDEHGFTKSLVVQESLAAYLLAGKPAAAAGAVASRSATRSANYRAWDEAGLLGTVVGDGVSATKAVVRARVAQRRGPRGGASRREPDAGRGGA